LWVKYEDKKSFLTANSQSAVKNIFVLFWLFVQIVTQHFKPRTDEPPDAFMIITDISELAPAVPLSPLNPNSSLYDYM